MRKLSPARFCGFGALALLALPCTARADIWDDACDYFIGDCTPPTPVVTTVVVIPPAAPAANAPILPSANSASAATGTNQRELMLQAATQHSMASLLEMKSGNSASALVEYTMAQQLARKANTLGNGPLSYPADPGRAPDPVAGRYESVTGSKEADLYAFLSTLQPDGSHGLDAAKAAYSELLKQVKNSKYADELSGKLKSVKLSEVTAVVKPAASDSVAASDITRKVESMNLGDGEKKPPAAGTTPAEMAATPSKPVASSDSASRSLAQVAQGRRELEELWLIMSDEQSSKGEFAKDVRGITLFERVKRRYRVWELRQKPLDSGYGPTTE
jgi:hypothetical protein